MLLTKWNIATALILLVAVAVERLPAAERGTPPAEVRGILKSVDAGKQTLTVTVQPNRRDDSGEEKTFTLNKTTEVGIGTGSEYGRRGGTAFREAKLSDLAPGALVVVQLGADQKTVECVLAEGPMIRGVIKAVDAGKGTVTITNPGAASRRDPNATEEEKTYTVGKSTEIGLDDGRGKTFSLKEAKLGDLPAGAIATIKLSADLKQVQSLLAEGPTIQGPVTAVDAAKRQVTVRTRPAGRTEAAEEQTYVVATGADIRLDDGKLRRLGPREGALGDVPVGAIVTLRLSPDQKEAMSVHAEGPTVYGLLKVADPKKNTITLTLRPGRGDDVGEEKTFDVAAEAHITLDGKESKLGDLKADDNGPPVGMKLSLDQKVVRTINVGGGRR